MTREEAIEVLRNRYYSGVTRSRTDDEWRMATDTAIAALRGPQPDPENGLVPCGCGGRAQMVVNGWKEFSAFCPDCGFESAQYPSEEDVKIKWNCSRGVKGADK